MNGFTLFFFVLGVIVAVSNLMKLVLWLDAPRAASRRVPRRGNADRGAVDFPVARLGLDRARHAA